MEVAAIIEAAVAATEEMTIGLYTIPRGVVPVPDSTGATPDGDPIPGVLLTPVHPGYILTGLNLHPDPTEGTYPIHVVEASPDQDLMEGMAITPGVITV